MKDKLLTIKSKILRVKNPSPNQDIWEKQTGFTLIEILVVFTIVAILAGIGIASFVSYSRSQQVNQSAGDIKLLVNHAKFNALSVVKSAPNQSGTIISCQAASLIGYTIDVILPDRIVLTQVCDEVTPPNRSIETITLPSGISIVSALPTADCSKVTFNSLSAVVSGTPCAIKISGYSQQKTIMIDSQGNTSIN